MPVPVDGLRSSFSRHGCCDGSPINQQKKIMYTSHIQQRGKVSFPEYKGERIYMREFTQRDGLPKDLSRWQPTVDQMLDGIRVDGPIFMMVDQSHISAGSTQRRPGVHIDGYWMPAKMAHGGGGHGGHRIRYWSNDPWVHGVCFDEPEAIILASDVAACRGYAGQYSGIVGDGGDCSGIDLQGLDAINLSAGTAYAGNVSMLHETLPVAHACNRTLVRLNVPGWSPELAP